MPSETINKIKAHLPERTRYQIQQTIEVLTSRTPIHLVQEEMLWAMASLTYAQGVADSAAAALESLKKAGV